MKLRNKETGEIVEFRYLQTDHDAPLVLTIKSKDELKMEEFASLHELYSEWEDVSEEPKEYWYLDVDGEISSGNIEDGTVKAMREIGNYFETKEEAEQVVEKLKAWKKLKDKGAKIIGYACYGGTNTKGEFSGEIKVTIDAPHEIDKYLFDLLFGGEE